MRKIYYLALIAVLFLGCKSIPINQIIEQSEKINLNHYDIYTFKLRLQNEISDRNPNALIFANGVDADRGLIHEMLYILRNQNNDSIIYFTTRSHKYIYDGGVFNDSIYKKYMVMNDLDYIYIGKEEGNKFSFYDPHGRTYAHNPTFYFTEKDDVITIDSLTNNYAKEKSRQQKRNLTILDDVFSVSLKFKKENKSYVFAYPVGSFPRNGQVVRCSTIYIRDNDVYLEVEGFEKTWYDPHIDKVKMFRN
ncbi:hypothetical protein IMCC3317_40910 [Kordia antarctica]|uniref:Lipoprotein n=1 Tax=Kordia antarctica TaxID=1218801 RepID=A0A7L4ZQE7_9FLAO|nr:hypothetical protein [Kordia antarctica]QHI38697.1 hypothetical protein IMCC3317_40910 [Kordia antarctica]